MTGAAGSTFDRIQRHVFGSTVAENIRLARPDADDAAVETALRAAHLGPWLDSLANGLTTIIGEGNAHVSGGERARIGIARSLLADHPVLVLDEPTAQLDTATAHAVTDDVLAAATEQSLVWITHGTVGLAEMDSVIRLASLPALHGEGSTRPACWSAPTDALASGTSDARASGG